MSSTTPTTTPVTTTSTAGPSTSATTLPGVTTTRLPDVLDGPPGGESGLPAIVQRAVAALDDPSIDPLEVAEALVGYPVPVPSPAGARLHDVSVSLRTAGGDASARWRWAYSSLAPGEVPDVDIDAENMGPGAIQLAELYDPVMAELGYSRANSTGSDPGEPGGPQSVNHVYRPAERDVVLNGVDAELAAILIWLDEDLVFDSDDPSEQPGWRFTMEAETESGPNPVPLLDSLAGTLPKPEGASLTDAHVFIIQRGPESFGAEFGLAYVDVELEWTVERAVEDVADFYRDLRIDGPLIAGAVGFPDPEVIQPAELREVFGGDFALELMLVRRYPGTLRIEAPDEAAGPTRLVLSLDLEPLRARLALEEP